MAFNLKNLEQMPRSTTGNNFKYVTDDDRYTVSQAGYFDLSSVTLNNPGNATINCLCPNHSFVAIVSSDGDCLVKLADRTYQYFTADTIADVTASGYFAGKNYSFDADESIKVQASDGPYEVQLVDGVASVVSTPKQSSSEPSAAGKATKKLESNAGDVTILVNSDSTGNASNEWPHIYTESLAAKYPKYTVLYYLWDDVAGDYAAAETIQTGTGSYTLRVYNAANSGKAEAYMSGAKFANGIRNIPLADLIIMNHGHNMAMGITDVKLIEQRKVTRYVASIAQMLTVHSGAGVLIIAQNPNRDDDTQLNTYQSVVSAAGILNADVVDVYNFVIARDKDTKYYIDDKHPSDLLSSIWASMVMAFHYSPIPKPAVSPLDETGDNILGDAYDISDGAGTLRSGWSATSATITGDTTNVASSWGYSTNIAGSGSRINYTLTPDQRAEFSGRWLTLAVRVYRDIGSPDTSGVIQLVAQSQQDNSTVQTVQGEGGFEWKVISLYVDPSMVGSYIQARLCGDVGSNSGNASFDRAVLTLGRLPRYA